MHTNVKTALGIFLFFFFGFLALSELVGSHIDYIKTLDDPIPLLTYFKLELFAFVFVPLLFATCWRVWSGESHWSSVWFHSGVPLGILASSISLVGMFQSSGDTETIGYFVGESLLAVFYGGVVSFIGYLNLNTDGIPIKHSSNSNLTKCFMFLLNTFLIGAGMHYYADIDAFVHHATVYIFIAFTSACLLVNRDKSKSIYSLVCETMVIASLASVIIALISYSTYQGHPVSGSAIAVGILGPLYGSYVIFQCATIFPETDLREIDFGKISWHLLEICGFWILMVLAPKSLLEMGGG